MKCPLRRGRWKLYLLQREQPRRMKNAVSWIVTPSGSDRASPIRGTYHLQYRAEEWSETKLRRGIDEGALVITGWGQGANFTLFKIWEEVYWSLKFHGMSQSNVAAQVKTTENMAVGFRHADHATHFIPKKSWHSLRRQAGFARGLRPRSLVFMGEPVACFRGTRCKHLYFKINYNFIKQLMVNQHNNSSSHPLVLLPQHVSVIRPSSGGIQQYTILSC
jgi:ABC-type transporter Mla maintaining outer membrane lipid asymmetry ATPase subunit MlaF